MVQREWSQASTATVLSVRKTLFTKNILKKKQEGEENLQAFRLPAPLDAPDIIAAG